MMMKKKFARVSGIDFESHQPSSRKEKKVYE